MDINTNKSKTNEYREGIILSVASSMQGYPRRGNHGYSSHVITAQPHKCGWMKIPKNVPNCSPGLESLSMLDQLFIKQGVCLTLKACTSFGQTYKFVVKNNLGEGVYWAIEDTNCFRQFCLGSIRPFDIKIWDIHQNEVIHFDRPLACTCCCFPCCCMQSLQISSPPGQIIGRLNQVSTYFHMDFDVKNHMNETVLRIVSPRLILRCWRAIDFKIVSMDGSEVGRISKHWPGLSADYFGISFPMNLDVRLKAVLFGASMLINSMFYEVKNGQCINNLLL